MTDCDYCGADFDTETAYLEHLADEHPDDLGPIEQRRVAALDGDDGGIGAAPVALALVLVAAAAVVGYVVFFSGGGSGTPDGVAKVAQTPTDYRAVHYHGTMEMSVMGSAVDFSRDRYQLQANEWHFEARDGTEWHAHARGVTLEWAMYTLDIGVTDDSVTYRGTTYTDGENANVTVAVNGEDVDPTQYVLQEGDSVRIVVAEN
ncbi:hypothetical protein [Halosegnis marinus]|uniref:C2H2-type domain-containing protein n=1 Tax=Halosegnis marinus TaxID=3034023 RepID=A0ABD5ZQ49_9EURY|nr:hypothetical protein [Halosegnis sp. DT85]